MEPCPDKKSHKFPAFQLFPNSKGLTTHRIVPDDGYFPVVGCVYWVRIVDRLESCGIRYCTREGIPAPELSQLPVLNRYLLRPYSVQTVHVASGPWYHTGPFYKLEITN